MTQPSVRPPGRSLTAVAPRGPMVMFALLAVVLAIAVAVGSALLAGAPMVLPVLAFALGAVLTAALLRRNWHAARLGPANALTLGRLALAMLLLVPLLRPDLTQGATGWAIFGLALFTLALDGIDGPLARHTGLADPWGARFDMEVDAVFALLLAAVAWRSGAAGPWVLLLGGMRYLFVIATHALPWLDAPLPDSLWRKGVCVVQIATLAGLLAPWAEPPVSTLVAMVALVVLTTSFTRDVIWLARRRP